MNKKAPINKASSVKQVSPDLPFYIFLGALPFLWTWTPRFAPAVLGIAALASLFLLPWTQWRSLFYATRNTWIVLGVVGYAACSTFWHYNPSLAWTAFPRVLSLLVAFSLVLRVQKLLKVPPPHGLFERRLVWIFWVSFGIYALHLLLFPFLRPFLLSFLEGKSVTTYTIYRFSPGAAMITFAIWPVLQAARSYFPIWKKPFWGRILTFLFLFLPFFLFFMKADVDSLVVAFMAASLVWLAFPLAPRFVPQLVSAGIITVAWLAPVVAYHIFSLLKLESLIGKLPSSWEHRLHIWHFVAEKIYEKPIFGWGFFSARYFPEGEGAFQLGTEVWAKLPMHPHNFLLQLWLDFGIFGPVFITFFMVGLWKHTRRHSACSQVFYSMVTAYFTMELFSFSVWQSWLLAMAFISALLAHRGSCLRPGFSK